jgi:hypothetical protein
MRVLLKERENAIAVAAANGVFYGRGYRILQRLYYVTPK